MFRSVIAVSQENTLSFIIFYGFKEAVWGRVLEFVARLLHQTCQSPVALLVVALADEEFVAWLRRNLDQRPQRLDPTAASGLSDKGILSGSAIVERPSYQRSSKSNEI